MGFFPLLYCILDLGYTPETRAAEVTSSLLAGGADILQLRAKNHDLATIRRVAETILPLCRAAGVPFILNDFPSLAGEIGADGVHIGQDDGSLAEARAAWQAGMERGIHSAPARGIHPGLHSFIHPSSQGGVGVSPAEFIHSPSSSAPIIGRSTHSLDQARAALAEGFDYIGFGPLFPTPTKAGRPAIGTADVAAMEREVGSRIPAFCIGGIARSNLADVLQTGARRVVIVSDLLVAENVAEATASAKLRLEASD